jgi:CRISPR-associated protein Csx10
MKALSFLLRLEEPLLATRPNIGEANSATSYDFIPGSMLRGALVRLYQEQKAVPDLAGDKEARSLFFDGTVCFLNAYPVIPSSRVRMLPVPRSWFTHKDTANTIPARISDFAIASDSTLQKPKSPKGSFFASEPAGVILMDPLRQVNVHNASADRNRKAAGVSQVYRYEALAEGQVFGGVIVSDDEDLLKLVMELLGETLLLGGSHTGGYGRVSVQKSDSLEMDWHEYLPEQVQTAGDAVTITLLSDVILSAGETSSLETFVRALGANLPAGQIENAFYDISLVGGFNRKWGLPLPQAWALQAGSVFLFNKGALPDVLPVGIGERQVDGFGRIAINWHTAPVRQRVLVKNEPEAGKAGLAPASRKIAARMRTQLLRARLEKKLIAFLTGNLNFSDLPSSSQLNRVRVVARQALLTGNTSVISAHLKSIQGAKKAWERARLNGSPLYDWVIEHSSMEEAQFRDTFQLGNDLPAIAEEAGFLDGNLLHEFCTRLIDGVMKLAAEQAREKEGR